MVESDVPLDSYVRRIPAFLDGRDTPRHVLERCLERIARDDEQIQAFVHLDMEGARRAADDASVRYRSGRPLSLIDGMPMGLKDVIETHDMPTQMNSPIFIGFQPRRDAACVAVLRGAGAVLLGKTATAEFACGRSSSTRNPIDPSRTPGGSSSGSAAGVGAGMVPAALGTQSQASTIRPASYCGVFGFKPTHGRLPLDGVAPLSGTLDHLGVFAGSIEDLWAVTAVLSRAGGGRHPPLASEILPAMERPRALVRLDTKGWAETDSQSQDLLDSYIEGLERSGAAILSRRSDARIEALERALADIDAAGQKIYAYEAQWPLRAYAARGAYAVGVRIREMIAAAEAMTPADYEEALRRREECRALVEALRGVAQGFITLSSSGPAIADIAYTGSRSFAVPGTVLGLPAMSLPMLKNGHLPLGVQILSFQGRDAELAATAAWMLQNGKEEDR